MRSVSLFPLVDSELGPEVDASWPNPKNYRVTKNIAPGTRSGQG